MALVTVRSVMVSSALARAEALIQLRKVGFMEFEEIGG